MQGDRKTSLQAGVLSGADGTRSQMAAFSERCAKTEHAKQKNVKTIAKISPAGRLFKRKKMASQADAIAESASIQTSAILSLSAEDLKSRAVSARFKNRIRTQSKSASAAAKQSPAQGSATYITREPGAPDSPAAARNTKVSAVSGVTRRAYTLRAAPVKA